jgi:hypothetical protein
MNDSFINKDPLLASSGLVPIYYWFYRTFGKEQSNVIRNFLVLFEKIRKSSRIIPTKVTYGKLEIGEKGNLDYINFDRLSKSLNDQASLQGCYNILESKWKIWIEEGKLDEK